jgi:hypothetical protein
MDGAFIIFTASFVRRTAHHEFSRGDDHHLGAFRTVRRRDEEGGRLMKRLLTTLVILTGLIGSAGAVWADEYADVKKTFDSGDRSLALKTA